MTDNKNAFDISEYKCSEFLTGLNNCTTEDEIISYVDNIVDNLSSDDVPSVLGVTDKIIGPEDKYLNSGRFDGFIVPSIKFSNSNINYGYHMYDRDYLYEFAIKVGKLKLPVDTSLLSYVMPYLDHYFGFPDDNVDRRDDVLYNFAINHAEEFYKKHNMALKYSNIDFSDQMELAGEFPISAFKGTSTAQCSERAALAQNILKMCGYNSCLMFGECESRGEREGHAWNALIDKNNNLCLMDFSNTVSLYKNGKAIGKSPYYCFVSNMYCVTNDDVIKAQSYHYEDGRQVLEESYRIYAIGRDINKTEQYSSNISRN